MSFKKIVDAVLSGVAPLTALESNDRFLQGRDTDTSTLEEIHQGKLTISRRTYRTSPETFYSELPHNDRGALLEYNSLRFIDPLRRAGSTEKDKELWLRYVRAWVKSSQGLNKASSAYLPASQRGVVFALGLRDFWSNQSDVPADLMSVLESHLGVYTDKLRSGRVHLVEETLIRGVAAMCVTPGSHQALGSIVGTFEEMYLTEGIAPGGTVAVVSETTRRWVALANVLRSTYDLEPASDSVALNSQSQISDLWVHATRPDGTITPSGSAEFQRNWIDVVPQTAAERYAATASNAGEASDDLIYTNGSGWAFGRSGWGETERDFEQETHFSLRFGRLESLGRHEDCTAMTFSAMGVNWIDDYPGHGKTSETSPWANRDHHSCVAIDGRYRTHGDAELTRKRITEHCFDLEVRDRCHSPVAMTRRLVYSRSGDYAVVVDQSRSADPHHGTQNWIVPPDCLVRTTSTGVILEKGNAACHLVWLNVPKPEVTVEKVGEHGEQWQRISAPLDGSSVRVITAIIPGQVDEPVDCRRVPLEDGVISVVVERLKHSEQLIITKEGAGIGASDAAPQLLVEHVRNEALTGGLSPQEERELRSSIRSELMGIKGALWSEEPNLSRRSLAIDQLFELAQKSKVTGLRDYGIGAALIDVAGNELKTRIDRHPLVTGKKRSPVISWSKNCPLTHEYYQVPIRTFRTFSHDIDPNLERQMLTFDTGQLVVPILLSRKNNGRILNVMFHGATDRSRNAMPRFERLRSMETLDTGPTLFVSDPGLDLDASQILTWYMGSEVFNLHEFLSREIELLAQRLGCDRILYVGNSGGGFAALQVASYSPNGGVVTFNPQIQIDRYVPRIATTSQEVVFGHASVANDPALKARVDVIRRYSEIGFGKNVYFIQNTGDEMHYENHFKPFLEAFRTSENSSKLKSVTPYLGPGHRVPPPAEYIEHVLNGTDFVFGSNKFKF